MDHGLHDAALIIFAKAPVAGLAKTRLMPALGAIPWVWSGYACAVALAVTLIGGYGHDWISGGTGDDGVIGDDELFADLEQAARYLNEAFAGLPIDQVRAAIRERLREERTLYDALMARALRLRVWW